MNSSPERDAQAPTGQAGIEPLRRYWRPRYWGLWLVIGLLRLVTLLPFRWQMQIGRGAGRAARAFMPKRARIARTNLRLCFPDYNDARIEALLREHFESSGMSLIEVGIAWWFSDQRVSRLVHTTGFEHADAVLASGEPLLFLSGHFPGMEIAGIAARLHFGELGAMYRPANNPFADQIIRRARRRSIAQLIPKDGLRQMIRTLKRGVPVWYASDQAYNRKYSAIVPFFGEPAMTNCALTHIARVSGAKVVPYLPLRRTDLRGYDVLILPPLENFPSGNEVEDALRVHGILEDRIREAPAQYYWMHRRFKNRPPEYPDAYADV